MAPPVAPDLSQRRLQALLELLPPALVAAGAGVWDYDAVKDRVVSCGVAGRLYGLPNTVRTVGVPLARLAAGVHPDDRVGYLDRVAGLRTDGGSIDVLYRTISTEGAICRVLVRGRCDLDASGTVTHASGLVLDLTDKPPNTAQEQGALARTVAADGALAALSLAADYAVAARRVIDVLGPAVSPALRASADDFLATLGRELAAAMRSAPDGLKRH